MAEMMLLIALSLAVGSFLACAAVRLPMGRGLGGRSACPHCGHQLSARELIPVLSWLLQRGRCRSCRTKLSPLYPLVELGAVAVALIGTQLENGALAYGMVGFGWALLLALAIIARRR